MLIAVWPTVKAVAILARPMAFARVRAVVMSASYPHTVDQCKTTIGGLHRHSHFVNIRAMAKIEPAYTEIGARLAALRTSQSDPDQKAWAVKHGFNQTQYNNWERGVRRIPVDEAERLCAAYGLTLDFIYRGRREGLSDILKNAV